EAECRRRCRSAGRSLRARRIRKGRRSQSPAQGVPRRSQDAVPGRSRAQRRRPARDCHAAGSQVTSPAELKGTAFCRTLGWERMPMTPTPTGTANERLEARMTPEQKELFKEAAALQGVTLTDFIVGSVHQAAIRALHARHVLEWSRRDQNAFVTALLLPGSPGRRLRAAWSRHA